MQAPITAEYIVVAGGGAGCGQYQSGGGGAGGYRSSVSGESSLYRVGNGSFDTGTNYSSTILGGDGSSHSYNPLDLSACT